MRYNRARKYMESRAHREAQVPHAPRTEMEDYIMCVGLPAKIVSMKNGTAVVDATGARREISTELLDNVEPGDFVMIHAGIAIAKITADDQEETKSLMDALEA